MTKTWTPHLREAASILSCEIVVHIVETDRGVAYCAAREDTEGSWIRLCQPRPKREFEAWAVGFAQGVQEVSK